MPVFDLRSGPARAVLHEITGRPDSVQTRCVIERGPACLRIVVEAEDPDMLNLIATVSEPGADKFIYDEDCVQIAVASGRAPAIALLMNARGSRKDDADTGGRPADVRRHGHGWTVTVDVPVPEGAALLGLSVHRFYRGVRHEVQGFDSALPHPLDPAQFAVVILGGKVDAEAAADAYRKSARESAARDIEEQLARSRRRMGDALAKDGPSPSVETAADLARQRDGEPVRPAEGFLCWNESYFQSALIDLWELTGKRAWLETAIPRMEAVWSARASERNAPDSMWGRPLPTWYNNSETGTACTLVSGVILNPIARLMRTIREGPGLEDLWGRIAHWLPLCDAVLALHDVEWVEFADGAGMHLEPYPKGPRRCYPRGGSRINPLNREFWFSMPMLNVARITGNESYLRKVAMSARYFKNTSEVKDGCFVWEYLVGACPAEGEDLSHAHSQVLFAEMCCREEIVFTEQDLRRMAATLDRNVFRHGDVPCGSVRGYHPGLHLAVGVWSSLCRFVPHVFPKVETVLEALLRANPDAFREGWGIRNLTCLEKARLTI